MLNDDFTVLAFDFGRKKIGVAIGQFITRTATPLKTISAISSITEWQTIGHLIDNWKPKYIVVGEPLNMDGSKQPITQDTYNFIKKLKEKFLLPVYKIDERLTTVAVKDHIFEKYGYKGLRKAPIDSLAAVIMLESWMQKFSPDITAE